jgi:hypothetical protein
MSQWGRYKCPVCNREWRGSIPETYDWFDDGSSRRELLEKICGCTGKPMTKKDWGDSECITTMGVGI